MKEKVTSILAILSKGWVLLATILMVLWMEQRYFNLLEAKAFIYNILALLFLAASFLAVILGMYDCDIRDSVIQFFKSFTMLDHAVFLFGMGVIMANLVSEHPNEAMLGSYGWSVGSFYLVTLCIIYFFLSRNLSISGSMITVIGLVTGFELLLILLNGFYVDPFGLHQGLSEKDYVRYVGTIGNTNWYVGYLIMILPFILMAATVGDKWKKIAARILLILATATCITTNTQGVYLGLFAVLFFYVILCVQKKELLNKALENAILATGSLLCVCVVRNYINMVPIDGINAWIMYTPILMVILGVLLFLRIILNRVDEEQYQKVKKILLVFIVIATALVAMVIFLAQLNTFGDKWGHNRGRIWRVAIESFKQESWLNRLFGVGANCFGYQYLDITGSDWVRNAHNEYVEYLVTTGIFGVIAYIGIYVSVFMELVSSIHRRMDDVEKKWADYAAMLAIMGYAAQAVVNNPQALNGVFLFIMLSICRLRTKNVLQ